MEKVLEFLKENRVFFYTTVDGDKPRVRPFGFFMVFDGKLCFGMGKHKQCYKQSLANPNVEICSCSAQGQWLRVRGTVSVVDTPAALEEAYKVMPALKDMYNEKTGQELGILAMDAGAVAEIADMKGGFEQIIL
jgi:uncharacterized pyridoxamine 5'-phosphate oxidase family protein